MKGDLSGARRLIEGATSIFILTHKRPDGDAVASLLALHLSLEEVGFQVRSALSDGVPERFDFLPGVERVGNKSPADGDMIIVVDTADMERISIPEGKSIHPVGINIDHHITNTNFGKFNLVDPLAASTTDLLFKILREMNFPITKEVATNLLCGLLTDTIGFRTENVTPEVLRTVAELQELGAPLSHLYAHALNQRSLAAVRYWGYGLSKLKREKDIVWTMLLEEDRNRAGYTGLDDADLVNLLSTIKGARIAVILIEQPGGKVKVSWRSQDGIDVTSLAEQFGGGGHEPAAGAMVKGDLEQVKSSVLDATHKLLNPTSEPQE